MGQRANKPTAGGEITWREAPLPYMERLAGRRLEDITLAVIHCTELPDEREARRYAEMIHYSDSQTGNSGHYYIDRDGSISRYVADDRVAHHVRGHNTHSIGIELVNLGRYPDWLHSHRQSMNEPYSDAQIDALVALLRDCRRRMRELTMIAGHQELDREQVPASDNEQTLVQRKLDPGPLFPWHRVTTESGLERLAQ